MMKTKLCLALVLLLVLTEACTQLESKIIFESSDNGKLYTLQWGVKTEVNELDYHVEILYGRQTRN